MTDEECNEADKICGECFFKNVCACLPEEFRADEKDLQTPPTEVCGIELEEAAANGLTVYGNVFFGGATCINNYGG